MKTIEQTFRRLSEQKHCALIPYLMSFYPDKISFGKILLAAQDAGADIIEVGIPFSDPIADGGSIQKAGFAALSEAATVRNVLSSLSAMKKKIKVPVAIMSYANPIVRFGEESFFKKAAAAGVECVIIPDLGLEESDSVRNAAKRHGVKLVQFVAPTTSKKRLVKITETAEGFIYLVSLAGTTGARPGRNFKLNSRIEEIRKAANLPVCVGFGIATPAQAAEVAKAADGVIIGSAIVDIISKRRPGDSPKAVFDFLKHVRIAVDGGEKCR